MESKLRKFKENLNREVIKKMTAEERLLAFYTLSKKCIELKEIGKKLKQKIN